MDPAKALDAVHSKLPPLVMPYPWDHRRKGMVVTLGTGMEYDLHVAMVPNGSGGHDIGQWCPAMKAATYVPADQDKAPKKLTESIVTSEFRASSPHQVL